MTGENRPYDDRRWRVIRVVLLRDGGACQIRLSRWTGSATAVDYIVDWRDGGAWYDATNLRAACASCNTAQRNIRTATRARAQRDRRKPPAWAVPAVVTGGLVLRCSPAFSIRSTDRRLARHGTKSCGYGPATLRHLAWTEVSGWCRPPRSRGGRVSGGTFGQFRLRRVGGVSRVDRGSSGRVGSRR